MQRDDMIAKVEAAYHARRFGKLETLHEIVAEDAAFTYAGDHALMAGVPGAGELGVHQAAQQLFETIELRTLDRIEAVAEGDKVAILWRTTVAVPDAEPFETLMFDLWEFDATGKICRGTQFLDTARLIEAMRQQAEA